MCMYLAITIAQGTQRVISPKAGTCCAASHVMNTHVVQSWSTSCRQSTLTAAHSIPVLSHSMHAPGLQGRTGRPAGPAAPPQHGRRAQATSTPALSHSMRASGLQGRTGRPAGAAAPPQCGRRPHAPRAPPPARPPSPAASRGRGPPCPGAGAWPRALAGPLRAAPPPPGAPPPPQAAGIAASAWRGRRLQRCSKCSFVMRNAVSHQTRRCPGSLPGLCLCMRPLWVLDGFTSQLLFIPGEAGQCTLFSLADASVKPVRLYGLSTKVCASTTSWSCSAASCEAGVIDVVLVMLLAQYCACQVRDRLMVKYRTRTWTCCITTASRPSEMYTLHAAHSGLSAMELVEQVCGKLCFYSYRCHTYHIVCIISYA